MFYFETRCFSSMTVRHDGEKFVENFSTIKKSLGAVSRTIAQFTNELRKRTGELGYTQLSELRLGEFSIRSQRFYEIKFRLKGNNKSKSLYKKVVQVISCQLFQKTCVELSRKWCALNWSRIGPKFNLDHLRDISMVFKIAALTPKSSISAIS